MAFCGKQCQLLLEIQAISKFEAKLRKTQKLVLNWGWLAKSLDFLGLFFKLYLLRENIITLMNRSEPLSEGMFNNSEISSSWSSFRSSIIVISRWILTPFGYIMKQTFAPWYHSFSQRCPHERVMQQENIIY